MALREALYLCVRRPYSSHCGLMLQLHAHPHRQDSNATLDLRTEKKWCLCAMSQRLLAGYRAIGTDTKRKATLLTCAIRSGTCRIRRMQSFCTVCMERWRAALVIMDPPARCATRSFRFLRQGWNRNCACRPFRCMSKCLSDNVLSSRLKNMKKQRAKELAADARQ